MRSTESCRSFTSTTRFCAHSRKRACCVSLAGSEHVVTVPFTLEAGKGRLAAHAAFRLTHADLGLEPFTAALGALKVRDDFEVDLTLEARPAA